MSEEQPLSPEVRKLIQERLRSIEGLEILLMLYRERARALSMDEIASQLRIGSASAEAGLSELEAVGLATRASGTARYAQTPDDVDQAVAALLYTYEHYRVETLVFIASNAIGRVRNDALRTFAEAFRLGGKKNNG